MVNESRILPTVLSELNEPNSASIRHISARVILRIAPPTSRFGSGLVLLENYDNNKFSLNLLSSSHASPLLINCLLRWIRSASHHTSKLHLHCLLAWCFCLFCDAFRRSSNQKRQSTSSSKNIQILWCFCFVVVFLSTCFTMMKNWVGFTCAFDSYAQRLPACLFTSLPN